MRKKSFWDFPKPLRRYGVRAETSDSNFLAAKTTMLCFWIIVVIILIWDGTLWAMFTWLIKMLGVIMIFASILLIIVADRMNYQEWRVVIVLFFLGLLITIAKYGWANLDSEHSRE